MSDKTDHHPSGTRQAVATVFIDNERLRTTEWRFAPGAETGRHVHELDYMVVPMLDGRLRIDTPDGQSHIAELKSGVPYYRPAGVDHNVINANDYEFWFLEVELR